MKQKEKNPKIVRCTDCRKEFSGDSVSDCIDNARCGRDGGILKDSCKVCLRTDGKNLFKIVSVDNKSKKKDNDTKSEVVSE